MTNVRSHEDLDLWEKAIELAEAVYRLSGAFPSAEKYGLVNQIRRAAVSVVANIAEGAGRNGAREFVAFLGIAAGSLAVIDAHLILSKRLGMVPESEVRTVRNAVADVRRLLTGLKRSLLS